MRNKIVSGLLILASVAALVGCGAGDSNNNMNNNNTSNNEINNNEIGNNSNNSGDNGSGSGIAGDEAYDFDERQIGSSNVFNSVLVTDMIAEANSGSNIMFSPTSLNMALGLVGEGASGEAGDLIASYLGTYSYGDRAVELINGFENYNSGGSRNGYSCKLEIANALWVDKRIKLLDDFAKIADNKYQANADEVDFSKADKACKTINKWADKNTHGMIPEIVSPDSFGADTVMCITNSLYFEAPWEEAWSLYSDEEIFTLTDGTIQNIQYMYNSGNAYFENDAATAFSCRYMNGLEFIGILPKEEGDFTLEQLDIEGLLGTRSTNFTWLNAKMPRLDFETSGTLNDVFKALGMGALFEDGADIDGIAEKPLYISNIIQKTKLELDENGTKAAAVTAITMDCATSAYIEEPIIKEVYLDRPFAFLIYDKANDEILFMGKVVTAD